MEILIRRNKEGDIILKASDDFEIFKGSSARQELFKELTKALNAQDLILAEVRRRENDSKRIEK